MNAIAGRLLSVSIRAVAMRGAKGSTLRCLRPRLAGLRCARHAAMSDEIAWTIRSGAGAAWQAGVRTIRMLRARLRPPSALVLRHGIAAAPDPGTMPAEAHIELSGATGFALRCGIYGSVSRHTARRRTGPLSDLKRSLECSPTPPCSPGRTQRATPPLPRFWVLLWRSPPRCRRRPSARLTRSPIWPSRSAPRW